MKWEMCTMRRVPFPISYPGNRRVPDLNPGSVPDLSTSYSVGFGLNLAWTRPLRSRIGPEGFWYRDLSVGSGQGHKPDTVRPIANPGCPHSQCQFCYSSLLYISSVRTRPPRISRYLVIGYLRLSESVFLETDGLALRGQSGLLRPWIHWSGLHRPS